MAAKSICNIEGCGKAVHTSGYCSGHYHRLKRYGNANHRPPTINGGTCSIEGCGDIARNMGWCRKHYARYQRNGDPLAGRTQRGKPEDWLCKHLDYRGDDCLTWPFSKARYGHVVIAGKKTSPHRVACEHRNGPAPSPKHEAACDGPFPRAITLIA